MSKFGIVFEKKRKKHFWSCVTKAAQNRTILGLTGLVQSIYLHYIFSVQKQISKRDQETRKEASKRTGDKNQPINLIKTHFLGLSLGPVSYKPRKDFKKNISKTKRARALKLG